MSIAASVPNDLALELRFDWRLLVALSIGMIPGTELESRASHILRER